MTRRASVFGYSLIMPAVLILAALIAYPLGLLVIMSLRPGRFLSLQQAGPGFGLSQYIEVFQSPDTWVTLVRTFVYVAGVTVPSFLIGLGLALLLRRPFRGRRWLRTLILLPWAVPGVAASTVFLWMLDSTFGIVNKVLLHFGLISMPVSWYGQSSTAMVAVIIPTVWKLYPLFAMVLMAALQAIPDELYEASSIDGAGSLGQFRSVTWPGIRSAAYIVAIIAFLGVFREFDFIFPLTAGGPNNATLTMPIDIYLQAFQFANAGHAAALGVVATIIAAVVAMLLTVAATSRDKN